MAEDKDKPEDEIEDSIEDEDDSDLFAPPSESPPEEDQSSDNPAGEDGDLEDPLGDALAQAAVGDSDAADPQQDFTAGDTAEDSGEDDSELFEPPHEDDPEPASEPAPESEPEPEPEPELTAGDRQSVLPATSDEDEDGTDDEDEDGADNEDNEGGADLFDEEDDAGEDEPPLGARQRYPWLQTSGEEEEELEEEHSLQGRTLIFVGAGVVFVIFAALIWFLYAQGDDAPRDVDVVLIEAPEGPAKLEPEDRGGMEIPDQDKLVYDRVSGQETELEENLLAGPEEPAPLEDGMDAAADEVAGGATLAGEEAPAEVPLEQPVAVEEPAVAEATTPVEAAPPPVTEPEVTGDSAPAEVAPPPVAVDLTHLVQLGAYGSAERAETGWLTVKNRHSITLAGLFHDIQRADLGARGVVYRLRTEPLSRADAQDLCADLKAAGQDCLVVRR